MATLPPRVRFLVGTGLLGASLSIGCTGAEAPAEKKDAKKDAKQDEKKPEDIKRTNEGPVVEPEPVPEPPIKNVNPGPEPVPEPVHVNEGPAPEPVPDAKVNPGPTPEK